jgi:hypothetical protein
MVAVLQPSSHDVRQVSLCEAKVWRQVVDLIGCEHRGHQFARVGECEILARCSESKMTKVSLAIQASCMSLCSFRLDS